MKQIKPVEEFPRINAYRSVPYSHDPYHIFCLNQNDSKLTLAVLSGRVKWVNGGLNGLEGTWILFRFLSWALSAWFCQLKESPIQIQIIHESLFSLLCMNKFLLLLQIYFCNDFWTRKLLKLLIFPQKWQFSTKNCHFLEKSIVLKIFTLKW